MLIHFLRYRRQNPANRHENGIFVDRRMAILILVFQNENCCSSHGGSPSRRAGGGTATSDTEMKCKFTGKIEVDRQGHVINGYFSCPKVYTPEMFPSEYALLYRALQGETISTVVAKKCRCGVVQFAIEINPTEKHGVELTIRALESVAPMDTIRSPVPDKTGYPGGSPRGVRHTVLPSPRLYRALHPCASADTPPSGSPRLRCASMS